MCNGRHCAEHADKKSTTHHWADTETAKQDHQEQVGLIQHMSHGITGLPPMNATPRYKRK